MDIKLSQGQTKKVSLRNVKHGKSTKNLLGYQNDGLKKSLSSPPCINYFVRFYSFLMRKKSIIFP
jgi:hypothetical protein